MVTLCIVFNHPHEKNIDFLRDLYKKRFDNIVFIHRGTPDAPGKVMQGYRGSYNYHGLVADCSAELIAMKSDLYVFIHDDVLLNPLLDQGNIRSRLSIAARQAFIPSFGAAHGMVNTSEYSGWNWLVGALWKLMIPTNPMSGSGIRNLGDELALFSKTRQSLGTLYGFSFDKLYYNPHLPLPQVYGFNDPKRDEQLVRLCFQDLFDHATDPPCLETPIPLFCGVGDFFAVDGEIIEQTLHGLGIMAAANIFAEVAIPTVVVNVSDFVKQNCDVHMKTDWGFNAESYPLEQVVNAFRADMLAYHPVKPSADAHLIGNVCSQLSC